MKHLLLLLALVCCFGMQEASAQNFSQRILGFSPKKTSYLTLKDGTEVEGQVKTYKLKKGLMKSIRFEVNGAKQDFTADKIASMRLAPSALGKLGAAMESASTVTRMENTNAKGVLKQDFVYFESSVLELKKKSVPVLLQLVNPGFDSKLKVYDDPWAQETASIGGITGGLLKSYYVVKPGETVCTKIKKSDYDKQFMDLFSNCLAMAKEFAKPDWKDFAEHVGFHEANCE